MSTDCTWAEARRYHPVILSALKYGVRAYCLRVTPALKSGIGAVLFVVPVSACRVHVPSYALTPSFRAVILVLQNFAGLLRMPYYALTLLFRAVILVL